MNIKKYRASLPALLILLTFGILTVHSCKKDAPTNAIISVLDTVGRPVSGASVTLWQDTSTNPVTGQQSDLRITKVTDSGGKVTFEFKLEAYLNILAVKGKDSVTDYIQLKEHETVSKTVQFL